MYPLIQMPFLGEVRSHTVMLALAVASAMWLGYRRCTAAGLAPRRVQALLLGLAAATMIGGRLHFGLAQWWSLGTLPPAALTLSSSGLHAPGAIIGGLLGGAVLVWVLRLPAGRVIDSLAVGAGVGIALARIGCFLHGCCFGTVCSLPWGVRFRHDDFVLSQQIERGFLPPEATLPLPVHPLQLYFAVDGLAIAALLVWLWPRRRYDGEIGLVFLVAFFASSALLELLRFDSTERVYWGVLPQLLWVTAGMTILCSALLAWSEYRHASPQTG